MMFMDCGEHILSFVYGGVFYVPQDCYYAPEIFVFQSTSLSALHFLLNQCF